MPLNKERLKHFHNALSKLHLLLMRCFVQDTYFTNDHTYFANDHRHFANDLTRTSYNDGL